MSKQYLKNIFVILLVCVLLFALGIVSANAHKEKTRHIHVYLKSDNFYLTPWWPHINPCTITVSSPSGYYKTAIFTGWENSLSPEKTVDFVFNNTPVGIYEITVKWVVLEGLVPWDDKSGIQIVRKYTFLRSSGRANGVSFRSP